MVAVLVAVLVHDLGKGYTDPAELPDADYPFVLTTGRELRPGRERLAATQQ